MAFVVLDDDMTGRWDGWSVMRVSVTGWLAGSAAGRWMVNGCPCRACWRRSGGHPGNDQRPSLERADAEARQFGRKTTVGTAAANEVGAIPQPLVDIVDRHLFDSRESDQHRLSAGRRRSRVWSNWPTACSRPWRRAVDPQGPVAEQADVMIAALGGDPRGRVARERQRLDPFGRAALAGRGARAGRSSCRPSFCRVRDHIGADSALSGAVRIARDQRQWLTRFLTS